MRKYILGAVIFLIAGGCSKDIPIINESNIYSVCNARLVSCTGNQIGEYCILGFKWGEDNSFSDTGIEAIGPQTPGGIITYSFQDEDNTINTHRQTNVPTESWDEILDCAQENIKKAIAEWGGVANITFEENSRNSDSDVQFSVAAILQSAVAYPNYTQVPCDILSGDVIFNANSKESSCDGFYINALHEIGHVLGLGHVASNNIMVSDNSKFSMESLQSGDIEGVQQIYGK